MLNGSLVTTAWRIMWFQVEGSCEYRNGAGIALSEIMMFNFLPAT
jgi:hypothetical protein